MDFRDRHIDPPVWLTQDFYRQMGVKIYQHADALGMFQLVSPDGDTIFVTCFANCTEDLNHAQFYAIEAPRNSPKRQEFQFGEISWMDFWSHKKWLLRIDVSENQGCTDSKYITIDEVDKDTLCYFEEYGSKGPLLLMMDQFKARIASAKFQGRDSMEEERDYLQFLSHVGHRLKDKAA